MRRVIVKNKSSEPVTIIWTLKEDSALHSPLFINSATEVKFKISNQFPHNQMRLGFGMGNWKNEALKDLADDLESLEIKSAPLNVKLASEEEIKTYLSSNLKGVLRKNITITIN
jgi:hypothetical protein